MSYLLSKFLELMHLGGPVMWILLGINLVSLTVLFERGWFWFRTNSGQRLERLSQINRLLREGDAAGAKLIAQVDQDVYSRVALRLLQGRVSDAAAMEAVELERPALDRFMPLLNTVITGAPMVGLIGTVIGLISSFKVFSQGTTSNPQAVGLGLSEALINTVAGLAVAVVVLFPYNLFRAQIDHTLGRFESLIAAAQQAGTQSAPPAPAPAPGATPAQSVIAR